MPSIEPTPSDIPSKEDLNGKIIQLEQQIESASTQKQLIKLLATIEDYQADADEQLRTFCNKQATQHQSETRRLEMGRMGLSLALDKSRGLKSLIDDASGLSSKITEKVRVLDAEKSSIQKTRDYVDDVRTLKTEIEKADRFVRAELWKDAAESIGKIRNLPDGLVGDSFVESVVPSSSVPDMPEELLARWIRLLKGKLVEGFNEAASKRDVGQLTYFFQLFPLIGEEKTGMQCYSRFVCSIISEQSRAILRNADGKHEAKQDFFARVLFQLYQTVAAIVNQHSPIIRRYYGDSVMPQLLQEIQTECDLQSGLIFDTFWDSSDLDQIVESVKQYGYPILVDLIYGTETAADVSTTSILARSSLDSDRGNITVDDNVPSLAIIGGYTDELSAMMNHWAMYCKFFVVTWNESQSSSGAKVTYPGPLITSSFMDKITSGITGKFDMLSTFVVRRTIEKACQIEQTPSLIPQLTLCVKYLSNGQRNIGDRANHSLTQLTSEDAPVSSMIDDITMALNVILSEAISTGQLSTIKSMVSNVKRILENDLLNILSKRLQKNAPRSNATLLTKPVLQKIQSSFSVNHSNRKASSTVTADKQRGMTPDLTSTGSMLLKSINTAISMASEEDPATPKALPNFIIVLNSISEFHTYLKALASHLIEHMSDENLLILDDQEFQRERKKLMADQDAESSLVVSLQKDTDKQSVQSRVETIVKSLSSGFSEKSTDLLKSNIHLLFRQTVELPLTKLINDTFKDSSYLVSSEMLPAKMGDVSAPILTFIEEWNRIMVPFLTTFTKENSSLLMKETVAFVAESLESKVWAMEHNCNELGAASLEKDMSVLISEVTKFDYSLRSNFVRVTQMIMLMGLDDDEDINDFTEMEWALTPGERIRARNIRVDRDA